MAALAGTLAAFAAAAPAQAAIYTVYACNAAGRQWDNRSWELMAPTAPRPTRTAPATTTSAQPDAGHPHGGPAIEGAGNYANGARDRLNGQGRWYGYPEGNADTGIVTVSRASFPALAGYQGGARSLTVRIGCTQRGTPCSSTGAAHIANNIRGAEIDVNDPPAPGRGRARPVRLPVQ